MAQSQQVTIGTPIYHHSQMNRSSSMIRVA